MDTASIAVGSASRGGAAQAQHVETICLVLSGLQSAPQWGHAMDRALRVSGVVRVHVQPPVDRMYLAYDPQLTNATIICRAIEQVTASPPALRTTRTASDPPCPERDPVS